MYFAAPKGGSQQLLEAIDRRLERMKADRGSAYYRSLQRWTSEVPEFELPTFVKWMGGGLAGVILLFVAMSAMLKWQVNARTAELRRSLEAQRQSEARYRNLAEITPIGGRVLRVGFL